MRKLPLLIFIASFAVVAESCNDSGTAVFNPPNTAGTCIWNGVTLSSSEASECCTTNSDGTMTYNYSTSDSNCPGGTPQQAAIQSTIGNYANTAAAGDASLASANGDVSSDGVLKNTGSGSAAATASFNPPTTGSTTGSGSGSATGLLGNLGTTTGGAAAAGGSAQAANPSSLFGSSGLSGSTATNPDDGATAASGAIAASGGSGDVSADGSGAYAMDASGHGGSHGGLWSEIFGNGDSDFGSGLNGKGSRTAKIVDLDRSPAADGSNAMGSKDPEDYFSLVNPGDSIFKIVERRYTTKAKQWALTDADAVASKVLRVK
jgi:hypothetical protein